MPQAGVALDQPWFVSGSLLGLDLAAADLRLSQISTTTPPVRAVLLGADRAVIIKAASLFNTYARTETELDHIAQTLDRGRDQVARLKQTPSALEATAKTAGLSRWRTTQLAWILEHQRDALEGWFTLRELYWLGVEPDIAAGPTMGTWGAASLPADGCLCVSIPSPRPWEAWLGRPGSGMVSSMFADLSLWVAEGLAARRLPADLAGDVLQVAVRHFIDRVRPLHPDDWDTVLRYPSTLTMFDFDEYVSSLTGGVSLQPVPDAAGTP